MAAGAWGVETAVLCESLMERLCRGVEVGGKDGTFGWPARWGYHFGCVRGERAAR